MCLFVYYMSICHPNQSKWLFTRKIQRERERERGKKRVYKYCLGRSLSLFCLQSNLV